MNYNGIELDEYKNYYGRLVVKFHKNGQYTCTKYKTVEDRLEVNQILPSVYDGEGFPGYDKVSLTYYQLDNIIRKNKMDWVSALSNQKAVYLITDTYNGKQYVGSATAANGMLLSRWSSYLTTFHGGNVKLYALYTKKGARYIKSHFRYTILEHYDASTSDEVILERESYWKDVLKSREFGYNDN